jgi:hypothetical protein
VSISGSEILKETIMKRSTHHLLAAVLAVLFGLFLTYGSLTSSDFPRGLYCPPFVHVGSQAAWWDSIALLHPNQVWNYGRDWLDMGDAGMDTFFLRASAKGLKVILHNGDFDYTDSAYTDHVPYWIQYYSQAQYNIYEAEWTWQLSSGNLETDPEYFYHFNHSEDPPDSIGATDYDQPLGGDSWKCTKATDSAGVMLWGPMETIYDEERLGGFWDQTIWPEESGDRVFLSIIKVRAATSQLGSQTDPIFTLKIVHDQADTSLDTTFTGEDLANLTWTELQIADTVDSGQQRANYQMIWYDNCDFWVDWIKYMDMERAYYMFYESSPGVFAFRDSILDEVIIPQCDAIESEHGADMVAWLQADEPRRNNFWACGVINDMAREALKGRYRHCYPPTVITSR